MTCRALFRPIGFLLVLVPLVVTASVVGCGGRKAADPSPSGFRLGAYDNCATTTILDVPGGGGELGIAGSVTLGQSGSTLTVSYGGDGGVFTASSLQFTQASDTSATLVPGQEVAGVSVPCAPLDFAQSVASLASGSLTYNAGTLFLSVEGADEPVDAGSGCANPGGKASILITCSDDSADAGAPEAGASVVPSEALASAFVGVYSCTSAAVNSKAAHPDAYESVSGNSGDTTLGTLTITETGGLLTAAYANDMFVEGSLQFVATTPGAAVPATASQTLQVECTDPWTDPGVAPLSALPVTSSTLTVDGDWVVLSVFGDMPSTSSCLGAETFVSLLCSR
jgi:hypothetical protein